MAQPAAKQNDRITATDTHLVVSGTAVVPMTFAFSGPLTGALSGDVFIEGRPAATVGSTATNTPVHVGSFVNPPRNQGRVSGGSATVTINGSPAARSGDPAFTCNDPVDLPVGRVTAPVGTVWIGG